MDGFFLSVFLAVCIVAAVLLRFICIKYCLARCIKNAQRTGPDGRIILPVSTNPSIVPAGRGRHHRIRTTILEIPEERLHQTTLSTPASPDNTLFTIYTFPQQGSPELIHPIRSTGRYSRNNSITEPPKYNNPEDLPPAYEELFPSGPELNSSDKSSSKSTPDSSPSLNPLVHKSTS